MSNSRYAIVAEEKSGGATYTPKLLADFVAQRIVEAATNRGEGNVLRILDPAIGHGELLVSLLERLPTRPGLEVEVHGFETDGDALAIAAERLCGKFPSVALHFEHGNFLDSATTDFHGVGDLFGCAGRRQFDMIIANPPYVRTQIMGAAQARVLSDQFGLVGRVDLYHAFVLGMAQVLKPEGIAGIIVSNRFMTTRSGASVRLALRERFHVRQAWDLGDTKLFDAAVLPAVLLVEGKPCATSAVPDFSSIYQTGLPPAEIVATDPLAALSGSGVVRVADGRCFEVRHGKLDTSGSADGVWRVATQSADAWLAKIDAARWGTFADIGKIRVGIKTCADKVFIHDGWADMPVTERPELLRPLTTHHVARRFRPLSAQHPPMVLYPHEVSQGRRCVVELERYPRSRAYLQAHRQVLANRRYVIEAGREWYELWVPQDPDAWRLPKLVFRDIAEQPTFWLDLDGTVVNGDCYWLAAGQEGKTDLLWLAAAVANSTFIECFYDLSFNNKLYAGRRRFITQYVERFPLPDPCSLLGKAIIAQAKDIYERMNAVEDDKAQVRLDAMVWEAFGSSIEEVRG